MISKATIALRAWKAFARCAHWAVCLAMVVGCCVCASADKTETGYYDLLAEYPGQLPDGAGVLVSMVEADSDGDHSDSEHLFMPDGDHAELEGITFTRGSSVSGPGESSHATGMARVFVGSDISVANGVTEVIVYEADHYLNSILNLTPTSAGPPNVPTYKVQNHSWIGSFDNTTYDLETLRRFDYVVDTHDMIAAVGLNNGTGNSHPRLFAHSYNGIAVGRSDGGHSRGLTTFTSYGPGRVKPDIVAPRGSSSSSTAFVSSVATMLYQSATDTANFSNADADAARSETMKAILMAGATKEEFSTWENDDPTQPLDLVYGAGELNVYNSFYIQQGGQHDGAESADGEVMADYGWDYGEIENDSAVYYELEVPEYYTGANLSAVLAWNVEVTDATAGSTFVPVHKLANLDLKLYDSTGAPLESALLSSTSTKDNVEHIWLEDVPVGRYTLEVSSIGDVAREEEFRDFGIAWRLDNMAPYRVTGDYNEDGIVDSADFTLWRDLLGSEVDLAADGDLNGVVDEGDYDIWRAAYGNVLDPPVVSAALAAAVAPEPGAALLLLMGAGGLMLRRARQQCC